MKTAWLILSSLATLIGFIVMVVVFLTTVITLAGVFGIGWYLFLGLVFAVIFLSLFVPDRIRARKRPITREV